MSETLKEEKIPCIFGTEIHEDCPVRKEFRKKTDISKWIKPKTMTKIDDLMNRLSETIVNAIETKFTTLSEFCSCCPFLAKKIASYEE